MNPALALLEFDSVAVGILAGDAMVKRAPVAIIVAGAVQPGHYLVLVAGDTASVDEARAAGLAAGGHRLIDQVFLPDVHRDVVAALKGGAVDGPVEAIGVIETRTVASSIAAADAGVKMAAVDIRVLRVADGLGGRGYVTFGATLAEVEAAMDAAATAAGEALLERVVIPNVHDELRGELDGSWRFGPNLGEV